MENYWMLDLFHRDVLDLRVGSGMIEYDLEKLWIINYINFLFVPLCWKIKLIFLSFLFCLTYHPAVAVAFVFRLHSMLLVLCHEVILVLLYLLLVDLDLHRGLILILLFVNFVAAREHLLHLSHPI
jgi:hypothetical protein